MWGVWTWETMNQDMNLHLFFTIDCTWGAVLPIVAQVLYSIELILPSYARPEGEGVPRG